MINFYSLWLEFKNYNSIKLKAQSIRKYNSLFINHILPFFKDYDLNDITPSVYINWLTYIDKKDFKNGYNKMLHFAMVRIFNFAIKLGYINKNIPSVIGGIRKKKNEKKSVDFFTYDEFKKFISVIEDKNYKILFEILFFNGLRIGECLALTWEDFKNNSLDINKTISKEKDAFGNYYINSPKTSSSYRVIHLDNYLCHELKKIYLEQKKHLGFNNKWYIFGGIKPFTQSTICRRKDNYCSMANIKKIRLHDFRHSYATLLINNNIPIPLLSRSLGHENISTTLNIYSHVIKEDFSKITDFTNSLHV